MGKFISCFGEDFRFGKMLLPQVRRFPYSADFVEEEAGRAMTAFFFSALTRDDVKGNEWRFGNFCLLKGRHFYGFSVRLAAERRKLMIAEEGFRFWKL